MAKRLYTMVGMRFRGTEKRVHELKPGEPLLLVRDASNKFDANAVQVWHNGAHVAFVKGAEAPDLASMMDTTATYSMTATFALVNGWPAAEA